MLMHFTYVSALSSIGHHHHHHQLRHSSLSSITTTTRLPFSAATAYEEATSTVSDEEYIDFVSNALLQPPPANSLHPSSSSSADVISLEQARDDYDYYSNDDFVDEQQFTNSNYWPASDNDDWHTTISSSSSSVSDISNDDNWPPIEANNVDNTPHTQHTQISSSPIQSSQQPQTQHQQQQQYDGNYYNNYSHQIHRSARHTILPQELGIWSTSNYAPQSARQTAPNADGAANYSAKSTVARGVVASNKRNNNNKNRRIVHNNNKRASQQQQHVVRCMTGRERRASYDNFGPIPTCNRQGEGVVVAANNFHPRTPIGNSSTNASGRERRANFNSFGPIPTYGREGVVTNYPPRAATVAAAVAANNVRPASSTPSFEPMPNENMRSSARGNVNVGGSSAYGSRPARSSNMRKSSPVRKERIQDVRAAAGPQTQHVGKQRQQDVAAPRSFAQANAAQSSRMGQQAPSAAHDEAVRVKAIFDTLPNLKPNVVSPPTFDDTANSAVATEEESYQEYSDFDTTPTTTSSSNIVTQEQQQDSSEVPIDTPARQSLPSHFELRPMPGKGLGVITKKPYWKGEFIGDYTGELMSEEVKDRRYLKSQQDKLTPEDREWVQSRLDRGQTLTGCYLYGVSLDDEDVHKRFFKKGADAEEEDDTPKNRIYVDAEDEYESQWTRFLNHASPPHNNLNPKSVPESYDGKPKVWFMANRDIDAGEELCFDYGEDYW